MQTAQITVFPRSSRDFSLGGIELAVAWTFNSSFLIRLLSLFSRDDVGTLSGEHKFITGPVSTRATPTKITSSKLSFKSRDDAVNKSNTNIVKNRF